MIFLEILRKAKRAFLQIYRKIYYPVILLGRPNICFIWIPKSAGSSIFNLMEREVGMVKLKGPSDFFAFPNYGPVTFGHVHYHSLQKMGVVSRAYHDKSTKFAIVRNPYDRVVSLYNYLSGIGNYHGDFDAFLEDLLLRRPSIGVYNSSWISMGNPQTDWLIGEGGQFVVDRIFKIEDLSDFFDFLIDQGIKVKNGIPHENKSKGEIDCQSDLMTHSERLQIVNKIYLRDFEMLGYKMTFCGDNIETVDG